MRIAWLRNGSCKYLRMEYDIIIAANMKEYEAAIRINKLNK